MGSYEEAVRKGPSGEGPVGVRVPQGDTQTKSDTPADETSPKAIGTEAEGANGAATLGVLTEGDREGGLTENTPIREGVVEGAKPGAETLMDRGSAPGGNVPPEVAQARDISPDAVQQPRIPATEREDESPAGLGKGVAVPPGSTGHNTGQTPNN